MKYVIVSDSGTRAEVEAPSWMMAMGRAMSQLGLSADSMGRWVCVPQADGTVVVEDPKEGVRWIVYEGSAPPSTQPKPSPAAPGPTTETTEPDEPESLAERLFDLSFQIAGAPPDDAGRLALSILEEFIPCEAASVARGTLNDTSLHIIAASGPVGSRVQGMKIPFGQGIVGLCFDMGISVRSMMSRGTKAISRVSMDKRGL